MILPISIQFALTTAALGIPLLIYGRWGWRRLVTGESEKQREIGRLAVHFGLVSGSTAIAASVCWVILYFQRGH